MSIQNMEVKGKTGYDIRTDILQMATEMAMKEFESNFRMYELYHTLEKREVFESSPSKPDFPSIDKVLEIANKMNDFVGRK